VIYRPRTYLVVSLAVGVAAAVGVPFVEGMVKSDQSPKVPPATPISIPALRGMSVFSKASASRRLPPSLAHEVDRQIGVLVGKGDSAPSVWWPGTALQRDLRVLMRNAGVGGRVIFAVPTSRKRVCAGLTGFSAGCIDGFRRALGNVSVTYGDPGYGRPGIVWGLAPDSVAGVEVLEAGHWHQARLENNAYFYEGRHSSRTMTRVKIHYRSGGVMTLPLRRASPRRSSR
jgi:hypothetical protein